MSVKPLNAARFNSNDNMIRLIYNFSISHTIKSPQIFLYQLFIACAIRSKLNCFKNMIKKEQI